MFQISSSIMDACILAALEQGDTYGYELTQNVKQHVMISESTLYPVLRRLQKDHCLDVYDTPVNGRNRRYYRITEVGRKKLSEYRSEWVSYKRTVDGILRQKPEPPAQENCEADGKPEEKRGAYGAEKETFRGESES